MKFQDSSVFILKKIKRNKTLTLSITIFLFIVLVGLWSNPSLESKVYPDTQTYVKLSKSIFDENPLNRPPVYPIFLKISSVFGGDSWTENVFLLQLFNHASILTLCFFLFNYLVGNRFLAALLCLIIGFNPSQLYWLPSVLPEMLLCFFITLCWVLSLFFIYSQGRYFPKTILTSIGTFSGIAALVKPVWMLGIIPVFISLLIFNQSKRVNFYKLIICTVGLHFMLIYGWKSAQYINGVETSNGRILTINVCMASLRSGLIKHGEGTRLYESIKNMGYLTQAKLLNGEDNEKFREIYNALNEEQRCDPEFERRIRDNARVEYLIAQMKYWHRFFSNRMFYPNTPKTFLGLPDEVRYLYVTSYSYFYRPLMPLMLLLTLALYFIYPKYKAFIFTSLSILIYFSLVVIIFTKSQSSVMRMRVPVEIILFATSLLPFMCYIKKNAFLHLNKTIRGK